jgi:hypothetical protein
VEEIESNDGSKCTKNKHFRKDPPLARNTTED